MQKKLFGRAAALAGLVMLAACASVPSVPYDRSAANVSSIAVVGLEMPKKAVVFQAATVGQSFGLIGALVDATVQANREGKVNRMLDARSYDAKASFMTALEEALQARGYAVSALDAARPKMDYLKSYPPAPEGVDALLDVVVYNYGFLQAGAGAPWRPVVSLKCRLVGAKDHAVLMESTIAYNALNAQEGVVALSPNEAYTFKDVDVIVAEDERALGGLGDAVTQSANAIATLLQ